MAISTAMLCLGCGVPTYSFVGVVGGVDGVFKIWTCDFGIDPVSLNLPINCLHHRKADVSTLHRLALMKTN